MEREECTGFSEKLHLVRAEAGTDLEENSAQVWTSVSNLKWLHCCSAISNGNAFSAGVAMVLHRVHLWHNGMVLVQSLHSPLKRQLLPSKMSPLSNISTDFFLQRERLCSAELPCSRRHWAFF